MGYSSKRAPWIGSCNWAAPIILGSIAQIILKEVIGIDTDLDHSYDGSAEVIRSLIGCIDAACNQVRNYPYAHMDFENWHTDARDALIDSHPTTLDVGSIGYDGQEGLYSKRPACTADPTSKDQGTNGPRQQRSLNL